MTFVCSALRSVMNVKTTMTVLSQRAGSYNKFELSEKVPDLANLVFRRGMLFQNSSAWVIDVVADDVFYTNHRSSLPSSFSIIDTDFYQSNTGALAATNILSSVQISERSCPASFVTTLLSDVADNFKSVLTIDINQTKHIDLIVMQNEDFVEGSNLIRSYSSLHKIVKVTVTENKTERLRRVRVSISHIATEAMYSSLTMYFTTGSLDCAYPSLTYQIIIGCDLQTRLTMKLPGAPNGTLVSLKGIFQSPYKDVLLYDLPPNYRPPSSHGIATPCTANIYNANLSLPLLNNEKNLTTCDNPRYKICQNENCNINKKCDENRIMSALEHDSDCISAVYKVSYSNRFTPQLFFSELGLPDRKLDKPYTITEVNGRTEYDVFQETPSGLNRSKACNYHTCTIFFRGTELFHFMVTINSSDVSFCVYSTEFMLYAVDPPLNSTHNNLLTVIVGTLVIVLILIFYKHSQVVSLKHNNFLFT